ncbi:MAG: DNA repair protein RecN [Chitinophagaceae bacterium]
MLQKLNIQNYAIIRDMEIHFPPHLNIITGETGAGKSILLGALSLILGERADSSLIADTTRKCIIEGIFDGKDNRRIQQFLSDQDLDLDGGEQVILRREITSNGKSRAFINDTPVSLGQLNQLGKLMVDLHQQFDTLDLGLSDFQREVIDALGGPTPLESYREVFSEYLRKKARLLELQQQSTQQNKEWDYDQFLFNELEEAHFTEHELEDLELENRSLCGAEEMKQVLTAAQFRLDQGEEPLVQQVKVLHSSLIPLAELQKDLPAIVDRLHASYIELQDIAGDLDRINDQVRHDPARIAQIQERLTTGYKLLKKHQVKTTPELLEIRKNLQAKLSGVLELGVEIAQLEQQVAQLFEKCQHLAVSISKIRHQVVGPFEKKVNTLLHQVGMPNARIKVDIRICDLGRDGQDKIEFLFDANLGNQFAPIRKVASGGELSRLMLCIKSLVATSLSLPTLIFDEIDSGISGEAAKQVGKILQDLSQKHQVICITHQPQIAGRADAHYYVYKERIGDQTLASIRLLTREERIAMVAQMLGGEKPSAAAMENAKEMIKN